MENSLTSTITSNPQVIELFKEELPTFQQLHNGKNRQVYPHIAKSTESACRNQFGIGNGETILYVQEIEFYNRGIYEIMGLVMTDMGFRVCVSDPMACFFNTFDKNTEIRYDDSEGLIVFIDNRSKINTNEGTIPIWWFLKGVDEDVVDEFGTFLVTFFNRIKEFTLPIEEAEEKNYDWSSIYCELQYKRERLYKLNELQNGLNISKSYLESHKTELRNLKKPTIFKSVVGGFLLLFGILMLWIGDHIFWGLAFSFFGVGGFLANYSEKDTYKVNSRPIIENISHTTYSINSQQNVINQFLQDTPECPNKETLEVWARPRIEDAEKFSTSKMKMYTGKGEKIKRASSGGSRTRKRSVNNSNNKEYGIMDAVGDFNNGVKIGKALYTLAQLFG